MRTRFVWGMGCVLGVITTGCRSDSAESAAKGGAGGESAGGAGGEMTMAKEVLRTSCGDVPLISDYWLDTPGECKACVDTECCDEAQACADNPDCKALWECRASCELPIGDCIAACNAMPTPPENNALVACRNTCAACLDVTTCMETAAPAPSEASYPVTVHVQSYTAGDVVFPGVTVKVCDRADLECANPLSQGVTDANGDVPVDVPSSPLYTDAYFEVTGPNVQPTRAHFQYAKYAELRLESGALTLSLLDSPTASALRGAMQATADPATVGIVSTFIVSCGHRGMNGMTAESSAADESTILQYVVGGTPNASATMTSNGVAIFADHPEGPTTITARYADTGQVFGTADLHVRRGFLNSAFVVPAP